MPSTVLLEEPVECPHEHVPWVREFLAACKFTAATRGLLGGVPVTESPHQYVPRSTLEESRQRDFDRFVRLLGEVGYKGKFLGSTYRYLDLDDHRFWSSPSWYSPGGMINRASNRLAPMAPPPPPELRLWEEPT